MSVIVWISDHSQGYRIMDVIMTSRGLFGPYRTAQRTKILSLVPSQ